MNPINPLNEKKENEDDFDLDDFLENDDAVEGGDQTPYDFRVEYKERISTTVPETEDMDKNFKSIRFHAIGIGILIGVLVAVLISAFFWGGSDEKVEQPVVITGNADPVKERPQSPGGMNIPDQDKTVYKRLRSDDKETKVESLFPVAEAPVKPVQTEEPIPVVTREGQILGADQFVPVPQEQMELEVISIQEKSEKVAEPKTFEPVAKPVIESKPIAVSKPVMVPEKAKPVAAAKVREYWYVQLISLPSQAGAEKAWPGILKAHSALLSGQPHDVVKVDVAGKGTFYRLRVGKFTNRNDAKTLCDKLKARKQDCALTK